MEYIHSALLLHSAGQEVTEDKVTSILEAAGVEVDASRVKALVASLEGVDIEEAMNKAVAGAAAPAAAPAAESEEPEEEAEEEEEEKEEGDVSEEAAEGLGGLF